MVKFLKVKSMTIQLICELIIEQNKQLLKIIAEEEGLPYDEMVRLVLPSQQKIVQFVTPRRRCDPSLSAV